ncbi:MAG TPA: ATP-binding protein [Candidatus Binataceae bacterium]|nr:ATP-binding protein [Candidatus Binataceae bacterium]
MATATVRQSARRSGLRTRIVLLTMAGTLGPTVLLGWLSWSSVHSLENQVLAERQHLAVSMAAHADSVVNSQLELLEAIAPIVGVGAAGDPSIPPGTLREAYLRSRLLSQVFLLGRSGRLIEAEPATGPGFDPAWKELPAFREALEKGVPEVSALSLLPGGAHRLFLLIPVKDLQSRVAGLVGGEIEPESASFRALLNFVPLDPDEAVDLMDQNGIVIASTAADQLYTESDHRHFLEALIKRQAQTAGTCHGCHERGQVNVRVNEVMAFAPLSRRVPWGMSIHQPEERAFSTATALRWKILAGAPALALLSLLFALGAAASITAPLSLLTRTAGRIAAGELKTPIPELGADEVGRLGAALERMRVALRQSLEDVARARDQLELRVEERTREIDRLYQELKQRDELRARLLQKLIGAQEDERRRIARELHDETSQLIGTLALGLDTAMATLPPGTSSDRLQDVRALAIKTLDGIHRMSFDLRPSMLDDLGLFPAIRWYAERDLKRRGVSVRCEFDEVGGRVPAEVETALFRAVQEVITNIVKHAEAKSVLIQCALGPRAVTVEIEDDGEGFDPAAISATAVDGRGLGLAGIRERLELLGGSAVIESAPGQGTRVLLTVPLAA